MQPRTDHNSCLVLVEGMDYSGKSTATKEVCHLLQTQGYTARINTGALHKTRLSHLSDRLYSSPKTNKNLISLVGSFEPLFDRVFFRKTSGIILQESYAFRALAYNWAHNQKTFYLWNKFFLRFYINFDLIFYLHADINTRLDRYYKRVIRNKNDLVLVEQPIIFQRTEEKLQEIILSTGKHVHMIDTAIYNIHTVSELISENILEYIIK